MSVIEDMARRARVAAQTLRTLSPACRADALNSMAGKLIACKEEVLKANAADLADAAELSEAFRKRLTVDEKVFDYMVKRLNEAAALPDPVGEILEERTMPSGLLVQRVAVPIGVLAMIYEARPNVTTDAAAVALKSGNAVILKGGSESLRTNLVLAEAMRSAAREAGLPEDAIQLVYDVHRFPGHIACDSASNSEIVVPIHVKGQIWGVLDIDSPLFDRFTQADREGLEAFVRILEQIL